MQLENYLTNTKSLRSQLESDYEKQVMKIFESKEHVDKLEVNLSGLNDKLDTVRTENCSLSENVKNLRKELDFYRKLNRSEEVMKAVKFVGKKLTKEAAAVAGGERMPKRDQAWLDAELERVRKEAIDEFELFNRTELSAYEEQLEEEFLSELDEHAVEFNAEADRFDAESDSLLFELNDLNSQLVESKRWSNHNRTGL